MKKTERFRKVNFFFRLDHLGVDIWALLDEGKSDLEILDEFDKACIHKLEQIGKLRKELKEKCIEDMKT